MTDEANHTISLTFNSGSNTQITYIEFALSSGATTYSLANGGYLQLEEGTSQTAYEAYIAPDVDIIAPIINGGSGLYPTNVNDPITVAEILLGLSSLDETDGALTVVVQSDLYTGNEDTLGEYDVIFRATDLSGNYTEVTTTIAVVDVDDPLINLNGASTIYLEYPNAYSELGTSVSDNYDLGLEAIASGTVDNLTLGTYTIYYNVDDTSGNTATQISRSVVVQDTIAPIQSLTGPSDIYIEFGDNYTEQGATWTDAFDISGSSTASGSVNVAILGIYVISYNITDSNGNVSSTITRNVIVQDTTSPVLTGSTSYSWNISIHNNLLDLLALITANDLFDGDLTSVITVQSDNFTDNEDNLGTYTVVLRATDSSGNYSEMTISIEIMDDIPPTFSTTLTILTRAYYDSMTQQDLIDYFNNQ